MIPRCYTCNLYLASLRTAYERAVVDGASPRDALDRIGVTRMCCRTHIITHVLLYDDYMPFSNDDVVVDDVGSVLERRVRGTRTVRCDTGRVVLEEGGKEEEEDEVREEEDPNVGAEGGEAAYESE